jgi:hypothetical protein
MCVELIDCEIERIDSRRLMWVDWMKCDDDYVVRLFDSGRRGVHLYTMRSRLTDNTRNLSSKPACGKRSPLQSRTNDPHTSSSLEVSD